MKKYILVLLVTAVSACSDVRILRAESGENVDFSKYKTFDFFTVSASGDTITGIFNARIHMLKEAISTELTKRGYRQAGNNPDMLVNIGIKIKEEVQTRQTDWKTDGATRYIGQRNYTWKSEEVEIARYREGTVALHLVDAAQNKMIWKGVMSSVVSEKNSNVQEAVQKKIKELFKKFPVSVKE